MGRGVSACATCDGFFYRGKDVVVVGGGNTAVEEALYLSNIARKVTVVHRRDKFRAEAILVDRLAAKVAEGRVEIMFNHALSKVVGDTGVTGVMVRSSCGLKDTWLPVHGVFIAIGHKPNTDIFAEQLAMRDGYITTRGGQRRLRHGDERCRCLCGGRRAAPRLSPGDHQCRQRLHGRPRCAALPGRIGVTTINNKTGEFASLLIEGFFDSVSNTISYLIADLETSRCALVDTVLDYDASTGRTGRTSADQLIARVRELNLAVDWILESHALALQLAQVNSWLAPTPCLRATIETIMPSSHVSRTSAALSSAVHAASPTRCAEPASSSSASSRDTRRDQRPHFPAAQRDRDRSPIYQHNQRDIPMPRSDKIIK